MNVCIIPARGGSKRIPRKNIKEFCGRPMISYSITTAIKSGLFGKVVVSTDDEEIAETAQSFGAEIGELRPKNLSDDYVSTDDVMAYEAKKLMDKEPELDVLCCLYATAPFVREEFLVEGLKLFYQNDWDFVFAATTFPSTIFRSFWKTSLGGVKMFWPEFYNSRSQDLPVAFHDAGQFYFGKPSSFIAKKPSFTEKSSFVEIPRYLVQDIDTPEDWIRAEAMYKTLSEGV